jgi:DNA-binding transcriptional ArsR family regulator
MQEKVTIGYTDYITPDKEVVQNFIISKLKQNRPVNVFCSFSYFTSNYTGIFLLNEVANLTKQGAKVFLVMWDINCQAHPKFKRILQQRNITPEALLNEKIEELKQILTVVGVREGACKIYKASDVLKRFVRKDEPPLFATYYSIMEKIDFGNLVHRHKGSHLVHMPLDMAFCNFFSQLYPEDLSEPIDVALMYQYQEELCNEIRQIMHKKEITNSLSPAFLVLPEHPYLLHNHSIPEWNMSADQVVHHMMQCKPTSAQIDQMYTSVLNKRLSALDFLDTNSSHEKLNTKTFTSKDKELPLEKRWVNLGYNLHNYLQQVKQKVGTHHQKSSLNIGTIDDITKIAKLLSKRPIVEILNAITGSQTASQLAKEISMAKSNMSTYLKLLREHNLIHVDEQGIIHRTINAISANFELGVN